MRALRTSRVATAAAVITLFALEARAQPEEPAADSPAPTTVAPTPVTPLDVPVDQLLEVTGRLSLRVETVDSAVHALSQLTAIGARLRTRRDNTLSFSIPLDRFADAMDIAAAQGVELDRSVEVQDRTPEYLETLALLRSAQQTRNRIAGLHRGVTGVQDPLRVEDELTRWDARVAQLARSRRELHQRTSSAILHVQLQPVVATVQEDIPAFQLPFPWLDELSLQRLMDFHPHSPRVDNDNDNDDDRRLRSDAEVGMQLTVLRAADEVLLGGNETAMAAGLTVRGVGEATPIGFAVGTDLALGGGFSGGFLYNFRMLGGYGAGISDFMTLGIVTGIGLGGLSGDHIPFGVEIPVEAFAAVEAGEVLRASVWGRTSWILGSEDRQSGSDAAPFGDEFSTGASLLLGGTHGYHDQERTGLSLRGAYHELMGTHGYEVSVGYGTAFLDYERD